MNMTQKVTASVVAAAAFSAILFTSASAMKPAQFAAANAPQGDQSAAVIQPLNSKETPESQLKDMTY